MVAAAHIAESGDASGAPGLRGVASSGSAGADEEQVAAEGKFLRTVLYGILIGMAVCAVLWVGLVLLAVAGSGEALGPVLWMAAGIGMFAGVFFGGWAGSMVGARALERHEQHERHSAAKPDLSS